MKGGHTSTDAFWEDFYRDARPVWSGNANALLVDEASSLAPGTALDLGCGQGGDAIWLAERGWQVTAVDVSAAALTFAAERAEVAGVSDRIDWQRHDLAVSFPSGRFDLVTACYLHSPIDMPRAEILRSAAAAVCDGGTLLVVGHGARPPSLEPTPGVEFPTADEVYEDLELPAGEWEQQRCDLVIRPVRDQDRHGPQRPDTALRLRRRPR